MNDIDYSAFSDTVRIVWEWIDFCLHSSIFWVVSFMFILFGSLFRVIRWDGCGVHRFSYWLPKRKTVEKSWRYDD